MSFSNYEKRAETTTNPLLRKLYNIVVDKKTNLCIALTNDTFEETVQCIEQVAPHACIIRLQSETYPDWNDDISPKILNELKIRHRFLIYENRELFDHCETNARCYQAKYLEYADFINIDPDVSTIKSLQEISYGFSEPRGCIALCNLTSADLNKSPEQKLILANEGCQQSSMCCGIIAQNMNVLDECNMIKCSPGVHIARTTDGLNQNWQHPSKVIEQGADVLIVGRGIVAPAEDLDLLSRCQLYKETCWNAYLDQPKRKSYQDRLKSCKNPLLRKLFGIIIKKQSNLCVAVNFNTLAETINFVNQVGHLICMLKVQSDRYVDWNSEKSSKILRDKKKEHNFILFEDRKFYINPDTIANIYKIKYLQYADLITIDPNPATFKLLEKVASEADEPRSCLALCELTYRKHRTKEESAQVALLNKQFCCGLVCVGLDQEIIDPDVIKLSEDIPRDHANNHVKVSDEFGRGVNILVISAGRGIQTNLIDFWRRTKETSWRQYMSIHSEIP